MGPRRLQSVVWVFLLLMAVSVASTAWAGEAEPLELSLRDAIQMALTDGTAARLARLQVEGATARAESAHSALLPRLGAELSESYKTTDVASFGFSFPGVPRRIGPFSFYDARINAAVSVIDLAARRRYEAAEAGVGVSEAERRAIESNVARAVATLYVAVERAQATLEQSRADVSLAVRLRDLARDQLEAGVATRLDTTRAEVQVARRKQEELVARTRLEQDKLALLHAIGAAMDRGVELVDGWEVAPKSAEKLEAALASARSTRPELASLQEQLHAAELTMKAARSERLPRIEAQAGGGVSGNQLNDPAGTAAVGAALSIPVFTGHRIRAALAAAEVEKRAIQMKIEETQRQVEQDVRRARLDLTSARGRVDLSAQNLSLAKQELAQARDRFVSGVSSSIEVDNAQTALVTAEQSHIDAQADLAQARFDLAHATGAIQQMIPDSKTGGRS
jgi:outer membrane protein